MSSFLVNLARRGAGLPVTPIQAPPPSPFGPEIRKQGDELTEAHEAARGLRMAEEPATGNAASQAPLRASSSEEGTELPSEAPTHHTPSIQRLSGTEPGTPLQSSIIGEPVATIRTPSLGPPPASRSHVIPDRREAEVASMEPLEDSGSTVPPFHADRGVIAEVDVKRGRQVATAPVAQEIEPVGEPARQASNVAPDPRIVITEPSERQVVTPLVSTDGPRVEAQETPEPALPAPTIRPALAESYTHLHFPQVTPTSAPTPPSQLPIHVRIGRVEVRATTAPTPARSGPPAPLGFDGYYRVRNYRS